jgi:hypothetical protein
MELGINHIWQKLDRLWPSAVVNLQQCRRAHPGVPFPAPMVQTHPFQRDTLRVLLQYCPSPHDLRALSDENLLALYHQDMGRCGPTTLRTLHTWTHNAVLLPPEVSAPLADQFQRLFQQYRTMETLIEGGHPS